MKWHLVPPRYGETSILNGAHPDMERHLFSMVPTQMEGHLLLMVPTGMERHLFSMVPTQMEGHLFLMVPTQMEWHLLLIVPTQWQTDREYFRGDVVGRPHGSGARHPPAVVHAQAGAKVRQPDVPVLVNQDVVWLDVPERNRSRSGEEGEGKVNAVLSVWNVSTKGLIDSFGEEGMQLS